MTIFNSKLTFTRRQPVFAVSIPALPNPELRWKTQSVVSPPARASAVHSKREDPAGGRVTDGNGDLQRNCYPSFTAESESKVDIMSIGMIRPFTMQHRAVKVQRQQISAGCTQISLIGSVSTCFEPQRRVAKCKSNGMSEWPCDDLWTLIETLSESRLLGRPVNL